jgi:hypothetical protein
VAARKDFGLTYRDRDDTDSSATASVMLAIL